MRRLALVMLAGGTAVMTLHGCGIGVVGVDPIGGVDGAVDGAMPSTPSDASSSDANPFTPSDAAESCGCGTNVPSGWALVGYGDRAATCAGDLEALDLVTDPDSATACGCTCTTTPPTCNATSWTTKYDNSTTMRCDSAGGSTHTASTNCVGDNGSLSDHALVVGPTPTGGKCTATLAKNVKSTAVRVCRQKGATCACDSGPSLTTCIATKGDKECPTAFAKKHLVGTSADVSCTGTCACDVAQSCKASVTWYSDGNCANAISTIDSETCKSQIGSSYNSVKYKVEAIATCTTQPLPPGVATLVDPDTVCCP